jgi:hypothetical protein
VNICALIRTHAEFGLSVLETKKPLSYWKSGLSGLSAATRALPHASDGYIPFLRNLVRRLQRTRLRDDAAAQSEGAARAALTLLARAVARGITARGCAQAGVPTAFTATSAMDQLGLAPSTTCAGTSLDRAQTT